VQDWASKSAERAFFPRRSRISRQQGFSAILKHRAQTTRWFAVHVQSNLAGCARLGITVSKRLIPGAVDRNKIKRMVRENFRSFTRKGIEADVVIRLRLALKKKDFPLAKAQLVHALNAVVDKK